MLNPIARPEKKSNQNSHLALTISHKTKLPLISDFSHFVLDFTYMIHGVKYTDMHNKSLLKMAKDLNILVKTFHSILISHLVLTVHYGIVGQSAAC